MFPQLVTTLNLYGIARRFRRITASVLQGEWQLAVVCRGSNQTIGAGQFHSVKNGKKSICPNLVLTNFLRLFASMWCILDVLRDTYSTHMVFADFMWMTARLHCQAEACFQYQDSEHLDETGLSVSRHGRCYKIGAMWYGETVWGLLMQKLCLYPPHDIPL